MTERSAGDGVVEAARELQSAGGHYAGMLNTQALTKRHVRQVVHPHDIEVARMNVAAACRRMLEILGEKT